ncbi:MAG: hypothetical protein RR623_05665 [Bacilli bacterium]
MSAVTLVCTICDSQENITSMIESINSQAYKNFTTIFVINSLKDTSVKAIESIPKNFDYKILFNSFKSDQIKKNDILQIVDSEYIYFCDSFSKLRVDTLSSLTYEIEREIFDIVFGCENIFRSNV